jgi:hypothetical protein
MRNGWIFLATVCVLAPYGLHATDPAQIDAAKQNPNLSPNSETTDSRFSPANEAQQRAIQRNDTLQDQRFQTPAMIERKEAIVGEKRAPIDMQETRAKTIIERKDAPKPEIKTWDKNRHDGEKSAIQPSGDQIKKYELVDKYQSRLNDAKEAAASRQPLVQKTTTFEKINRFVFQRNGPGSDGGKAMVTTAGGGGTPPPSQDSYVKYRVDWSKGQTVPVEPATR